MKVDSMADQMVAVWAVLLVAHSDVRLADLMAFLKAVY